MGGISNTSNEQMQMSAAEVVVLIKNTMQEELARRHGEKLLDFIDQHAKDFGDYIEAHQDLLRRYKSDPDGALEEVEKIIYH